MLQPDGGVMFTQNCTPFAVIVTLKAPDGGVIFAKAEVLQPISGRSGSVYSSHDGGLDIAVTGAEKSVMILKVIANFKTLIRSHLVL